jgi:tetraacyldisaccharide 4'-kinase
MSVGASAMEMAWYRGAGWLILLRPFELFFRVLAALRRWLYRLGVLKVWRSPVPVVVVGNITVGGTGKTPIVIALVEYLQEQGFKPGVVSRGYGATHSHFPHSLTAQSTVAESGDEPLLIYRRTGCPCVVAPDRVAAVQQLLKQFDVDIVLSDDGLQHYALARDYEIAVLDSQRGMGNGYCLPAGPLREPRQRLEQVDYVLHRGSIDPQSGVCYRGEVLVNVVGDQQLPFSPSSIGETVHAVAGIGQPEQFFSTLKEHGFAITTHQYADHHLFTANDFRALIDLPLIMTEKDAVKCRDIVGDHAWYLKISAQVPQQLEQAVSSLVRPNTHVS